jgi:DNA-binding transcriptional regulator YhcF (GntR family)
MKLRISQPSAVPPFEQVREQIASAIDSGELSPEERLPTVRELAVDLGLAANTVARSYRELEAAGVVVTRGRHGTFVTGQPSPERAKAQQLTLGYLDSMRQLGFGYREILAIVTHAISKE